MPDKTIVYVSGAMSGEESYGFPAFDEAAQALRDVGYRVINPADFGADQKHSWGDCIARDLYILNFAHIIAQLPGWEHSRGATLEAEVAAKLGKRIYSLEELLDPRLPLGGAKREALEAAGFKIGDARDFLKIADDEEWEALIRRHAG